MQVTGGVRLLTKQYQGFILDQFGVLHNGSQVSACYPQATTRYGNKNVGPDDMETCHGYQF